MGAAYTPLEMDEVEDLSIFNSLIPGNELIYYDGPMFFTIKDRPMLALSVDLVDGGQRFLVTTTTPEILELLERKQLSIRCAMQAGWAWIVDTGPDFCTPKKAWVVDPDSIPDVYLPEEDIFLERHEDIQGTNSSN